jgi:arylsulfatase
LRTPTTKNARYVLFLLGCGFLAGSWISGCNRHQASWATPTPPLPQSQSQSQSADKLPAEQQPLGVILITVDTLRADHLSIYGNTRVLTPNIDHLAASAVLFRTAIAQTSTTTPSHASIMTSLYLQDHNVYSNFDALGNAPRTLAEVTAGRGYNTFAIVNMRHLNPEISGLGQGFQTFVRSESYRRAADTIDELLKWLNKIGEKQFFAWVHFVDVHTPYAPPPPYNYFYYDQDRGDPDDQSLARIWHLLPTHMTDHPFFLSWLEGVTDLRWVIAQYQGAVSYVDDEIGRLIEKLKQRDILDRVGIVLTSDHGESLGEHDMYFVHTGLYEPTIQVPLIMYFPGVDRKGIHVREVVETIDIMPTVLEYLSIPQPKALRGRSLWPLIRGEIVPPHIALSEHAGRSLVSLRSERYKYIKHLRTLQVQPSYPFVEGREELYDLKKDPFEKHDISQTAPEIISFFRQELAIRRAERQEHVTGAAKLDEQAISILRALGYVR